MEQQTSHHHFPMPMGNYNNASRIMRRSIFTFLQSYHFFSLTPSLLLLPFALSTLLSSPLVASSYLFSWLRAVLRSLFLVAGLPPSSDLFLILNVKLSQTILSSLFIYPFALSFLLFAKASIINAFDRHNNPSQKHTLFSHIARFKSLLFTQLCNSLLIISTNVGCLILLVVSFNCADALGLSSPKSYLIISATGAIFYSIFLANAYIICGLSLIVSGLERPQRRGGFTSILEACALLQGRTPTALSLAVPINAAMAGVDALFQYRVVRAYRRAMAPNSWIVLEATLVAYMYAMLIVIDTIVGYMFLKSCRSNYQIPREDDDCCHTIEIHDKEGSS